GALSFDLSTLDWVVVYEHEAVQSQLQLGCKFPQVLGLGIPIYPLRGDIVSAQHHARILAEHSLHIFFDVLAAQAYQHAGFDLLLHKLLQRSARSINRNSDRAVLAANPPPEGVI